jgi:hypothetical protein
MKEPVPVVLLNQVLLIEAVHVVDVGAQATSEVVVPGCAG